MDQTEDNKQPESPKIEQPIETTTTDQPEIESPEFGQTIESSTTEQPKPEPVSLPKEEKSQSSKFGVFLRKALIWLLVISLAFLGGFLLDHFLRYRPLAATSKETQSALDQANQTLDDVQSENRRLKSDINAADEQISSLQEDLDAANANIKFFQILADVNNARVNLFLEDIEGAQTALADIQNRLQELLPIIEEIDPELAVSLPRRLDLIVSGLERNPETGRIDLELFTKDLLELQPLLLDN